MPQLENLEITVFFELHKTLNLKKLKQFYFSDYTFDEINPVVSQTTIEYLTQCDFENLEEFEIALTSEETAYIFNEKMFEIKLPHLHKVAVEGLFVTHTKNKLSQTLHHLGKRLNLKYLEETD